MLLFKSNTDIKQFCDYLVNTENYNVKINSFVENKIKENILSPEKISIHLFMYIDLLKDKKQLKTN